MIDVVAWSCDGELFLSGILPKVGVDRVEFRSRSWSWRSDAEFD